MYKDKQYTKLLALLKNIRKEKKLTQKDIAEKLGKPQSFVSKYELAEKRLDILELRQLCKVLGIDLKEFIDRLEKVLDN